jgi:radical SAM superfamily enzyme YgiQ (UPF0313 family)
MTGKLDILLINPGDRKQIYQSLGQELAAVEPPVWAGLMASFVRGQGLSAAILDSNAENITPQESAQRVRDFNPLLTVIVVYGHNPSASTQVMPSANAICNAIKEAEPERQILMVGGHVASLPEQTLREEMCDFVATGEGLYTMTELCFCLRANDKNFSRVPGLGKRTSQGVSFTPETKLVSNLDQDMPGMAWDLLPMEKYRAHNWHCFGHLNREPYAAIYTTLGCPYKCGFCCIQAPFKKGEAVMGMKAATNSYRFWSVDQVLSEMELLIETYGVTNFKFADEMFVLNKRHVEGICTGIIERGWGDRLNIWAYARVDTVKDNMIEKLRRAGFRWLAFGIEAADESVRDDVQKGYKPDDIYTTCKKVQDADIYVAGNFIFGLPEDTHETMQKTLDMALDLNIEYANFYSAMAYPGSALYQQALARGWDLPDTWGGYSQHARNTKPLPTKHLSNAEVLAFRDEAFHTYFTHKPYLDLVRKRFGEDTVAHIERMTAHRLVRDLIPAS